MKITSTISIQTTNYIVFFVAPGEQREPSTYQKINNTNWIMQLIGYIEIPYGSFFFYCKIDLILRLHVQISWDEHVITPRNNKLISIIAVTIFERCWWMTNFCTFFLRIHLTLLSIFVILIRKEIHSGQNKKLKM